MPSTKAIDWKRRSRHLACLMGAAMLASGPGQMAFAHEGAAMNVTSNGVLPPSWTPASKRLFRSAPRQRLATWITFGAR